MGNRCKSCRWQHDPTGGGHCYMFPEEPVRCAQWSATRAGLDYPDQTISPCSNAAMAGELDAPRGPIIGDYKRQRRPDGRIDVLRFGYADDGATEPSWYWTRAMPALEV